MIRPVLLTLTIAACELGTPHAALGQAPTAEVRQIRALYAAALMTSSASYLTAAVAGVARVAAQGARVSHRDLNNQFHGFNNALETVERGGSRYGNMLSGGDFREDTDAILADAVRSRTLEDPLVAALLAAREAAEAAVTIPGWGPESRNSADLVRVIADPSVLESATRFGRAAFSALQMAVERANDGRATAAEAEIRAAAGGDRGPVSAALRKAVAGARFNAVWETAQEIARTTELEGADYLELESQLMWQVYSAASAWYETIPSDERR